MKKILANIKNDGQGGEARSQLHDGHTVDKKGKTELGRLVTYLRNRKL